MIAPKHFATKHSRRHNEERKKAARAFVSAERTDEDREEEMTGAWKISGVKRILHTCLCFFVPLSSPLPFMSFIKMFA